MKKNIFRVFMREKQKNQISIKCKSNNSLAKGLSIYLDIVRFSAAAVVFLYHLGYGKLAGGYFAIFHQFGTPAVIIFFVLSGFVIRFVTINREDSASAFAAARMSRLYSVVIPALILTALLDTIGRHSAPDLYPNPLSVEAFLSCLLFVNASWFHFFVFGTAGAYWSLGFEVWYYITFGLLLFSPKPGRFVWAAAALVFAGPDIAVMFPAWLLGCLAYEVCLRRVVGKSLGFVMFAAPPIAFAICVYFMFFNSLAEGLGYSFLQITTAYIIAVLFFVHVIGAYALSPAIEVVLSRVARPIRWLAGATFTLYLLHLPIAFFIRSQLTWPVNSWKSQSMVVGLTIVLVFLIAEFTERRKDIWHEIFARLLNLPESSAHQRRGLQLPTEPNVMP